MPVGFETGTDLVAYVVLPEKTVEVAIEDEEARAPRELGLTYREVREILARR